MTPSMRNRADRVVEILEGLDRPAHGRELADLIWGDDPDGGPLSAETLVKVAIHAARRAGDDRIRTTLAGYALASWEHDRRWDTGRTVWTDALLDRVERLTSSGLTHGVVADRLGVPKSSLTVALCRYRPETRRYRRAA